MVTTRSKNSGQAVNSGVFDAADLQTGANVGNAKEGDIGMENISSGGDIASTQQKDRVKRLARKLKPLYNSGSGMPAENNLVDSSSSSHSQLPMKRNSSRVQALMSGECQDEQKQAPSSLDRDSENGQNVRFARQSNTGSILSNQEDGTVGNQQKANRKHQKLKKKTRDFVVEDSFTKPRRLVKQLIGRIKMEQNLIEAYSGEGWKGSNREKIRPEKELKRAEVQILKCKFAIREVIRDLCLKCSEGSISDSALDSEGQIPVDEIFCAKCLSHQEFPDNDIILCDGACNRAFHQKCLDPPLAFVDIPPGDEGWLCPACDCKFDCLSLIEDVTENSFELETSWEEVFPEADPKIHTSSEAGYWPSDDSEDDDYEPDQLGDRNLKTEVDDQEDFGDSSSCSTGSSDLSGSEEQSENDSEDEKTLLSEDKRKPMHSTQKKHQRITLSDADDPETSNLIVSDRRQRIEVDYKKLNDEMFGKDDSNDDESSDDEWGPSKRSKQKDPSPKDMSNFPIPSTVVNSGKISKLASQKKEDSVARKSEQQTANQNLCGRIDLNKEENISIQDTISDKLRKQEVIQSGLSDAPNIRSNKILNDSENEDIQSNSSVLSRKASTDTGQVGNTNFGKHKPVRTTGKPSKIIIPEMAVQRLKEAFAENTLPIKPVRENLSKDLGLSYERVTSWFKNQRNNLAKKCRALASNQVVSGANTSISLQEKAINSTGQIPLRCVLAESGNIEKCVEDQ